MFPKVSNKELIVLSLLSSKGQMFGLQLVKESSNSIGRGTVYVTLARMEKKGLVRSFRIAAEDGVEGYKKHYEITGEGQHTLRATETALATWKGDPGHVCI